MALIPVGSVEFEGETIKHLFFLDVMGGDKMFMIFESGKVVILPVYRGCPVQEGTVQDLIPDFKEYREKLKESLTARIESNKSVEEKLKEIEDGVD